MRATSGNLRVPPPAARMLWLAAPFALLALPTRWLIAAPSICLIRRATGRPCPGCGMTRALSRLAHGDPRGAWRHNPRVVLVAPMLAGLWAWTVAETLQQRPHSLAGSSHVGDVPARSRPER